MQELLAYAGSVFPYMVGVWVLIIGLYGVVSSRNVVHLIVCLLVVQSSTYILLLAIGYRSGSTAPILSKDLEPREAVDPVVQAMALTDIVVGAAVAALLLSIAVQSRKRFGSLNPDEQRATKG